MRLTVLPAMTCIVLVLASQGGSAAQQASVRADDVAAIRKHIESICQAFVDKDRKTWKTRTGRTGVASRHGRTMSSGGEKVI